MAMRLEDPLARERQPLIRPAKWESNYIMAYSTLDPTSEVIAFTGKWSASGEKSLTKWEKAVLMATGYIEYPPDHELTKTDYAARSKHEPAEPSIDWRAPFHMPKFNNEQYLEAKKTYVAQHGYTITIPALSDIFHFGKPAPMTPMERYEWSQKNWDYFSDDRLAELEKDKQHKKDRMLAMLAGPTPELFAKLGAILTAVDDAQDAISTLAVVLRVARKMAPKAVQRLIAGPLGLLLTVNDILNLITSLGSVITFAGFAKKTKDHVTASNPFSKKARIKRWKKTWTPKITFADVIQAAQTTDQVFGVGDQVQLNHWLFEGVTMIDQVMPSGLVITLLNTVVEQVAQKSKSSGDQQTEIQSRSNGVTLIVHEEPSGLVITRLRVPVFETAQNRESSGDQQILSQSLSAAESLVVQLVPSGLVITRLLEPVFATAQNIASSGDQHTQRQSVSVAAL